MWPFLGVTFDPFVEILLWLCESGVELVSEGDAVERVERRLVAPLDDAIGLWALGLGARVIDILPGAGEVVLVAFGAGAMVRSPVG